MRERRNTAVQVQSADRFKGQMNQKFDFFYSSSILVKCVVP